MSASMTDRSLLIEVGCETTLSVEHRPHTDCFEAGHSTVAGDDLGRPPTVNELDPLVLGLFNLEIVGRHLVAVFQRQDRDLFGTSSFERFGRRRGLRSSSSGHPNHLRLFDS